MRSVHDALEEVPADAYDHNIVARTDSPVIAIEEGSLLAKLIRNFAGSIEYGIKLLFVRKDRNFISFDVDGMKVMVVVTSDQKVLEASLLRAGGSLEHLTEDGCLPFQVPHEGYISPRLAQALLAQSLVKAAKNIKETS